MNSLLFIKRFLILLLITKAIVGYAKITAEVKPNQIHVGETFNLIFTMDSKDNGIPNLLPLRQDFEIQGTQQSVSYSILNGQTQSVSQWIVLLIAKKAGRLTIPAIHFAHEISPPIIINVLANGSHRVQKQTQDIGKSLFLKTSAEPKEVLINQQIRYTVQIYNSEHLLDAEFQPPSVENALLIPLGESQRYRTTVDDKDFLVEEQEYVIFLSAVVN